MTQVVYFVNSGSEANDMAMMMARLYSNNYDILALRNAYHGMSAATMGLVAHSTWKFSVPQVCPPCDSLLVFIASYPSLRLAAVEKRKAGHGSPSLQSVVCATLQCICNGYTLS